MNANCCTVWWLLLDVRVDVEIENNCDVGQTGDKRTFLIKTMTAVFEDTKNTIGKSLLVTSCKSLMMTREEANNQSDA